MERRQFLEVSSLGGLQFVVQACGVQRRQSDVLNRAGVAAGFGPIIDAPGEIVELPKGFRYVVLQADQALMSDGYKMADQPDGMACFEGDDGRYVILRNHELDDASFLKKYNLRDQYSGKGVPEPRYRDNSYGAVSRLVIDPDVLAADLASGKSRESKSVQDSRYVLVGTRVNCAGGVLDGGWVTCEESSSDEHGYAFLTRPEDDTLREPRRIRSWGRFHREAIAVDPDSGVVYMTEDRPDSCLYRFVPDDPKRSMGSGRLQALSISGLATTSPYETPGFDSEGRWVRGHKGPKWANGKTWQASWVNVPDPQAEKELCRHQAAKLGATQFYRGEGISWNGKSLWFSASVAGEAGGGQIFRLDVDGDTGVLTLVLEITDRSKLSSPDNLIVSPYGHLLMGEDNYDAAPGVTHQYLRGMTLDGQIYDLARNPQNELDKRDAGAEFTGMCFSPCGRFLFVNMQRPIHATIAITGPWPKAGH